MATRTSRLALAAMAAVLLLSVASCGPVAQRGPAPASGEPILARTLATETPEPATVTTFAVIGDYGTDDTHERAVARLVASWHPAFVLAVGDDYYKVAGGSGTGKYDESTGAHYGAWLKDITTTGKRLPVGLAAVNAFFPALGNHDYSDATPSPRTYLTYFRLPGAGFSSSSGSERYYDFVDGPVHFFVLNSNTQEQSGTSKTSKQALWLKRALAASSSPWNVVYDHHPPYSSESTHRSSAYMRWPFAAWGADVVISGHAHDYERVLRDGIVYFVNGMGGGPRYVFGKPIVGSKVRYRSNWGAQRAVATSSTLEFEFFSVGGRRVDTYRLTSDE